MSHTKAVEQIKTSKFETILEHALEDGTDYILPEDYRKAPYKIDYAEEFGPISSAKFLERLKDIYNSQDTELQVKENIEDVLRIYGDDLRQKAATPRISNQDLLALRDNQRTWQQWAEKLSQINKDLSVFNLTESKSR